MATSFTVASFNVENLFGRAKVLNLQDQAKANEILGKISEFKDLIAKTTYAPQDKKRIVSLYNDELKPYIEVREDRGKLFKMKIKAVVDVAANGAEDWDGSIAFKRAEFDKATRGNTAQVLKDTKSDIACIVEAEDFPALKAFNKGLLGSKYGCQMLIDGNDPRGIDVGLYTKFPIGGVWTHIFDKDGRSRMFSRDCLEVELQVSKEQKLFILCNHLKSRGYDYDGTADERRTRQARRVAEILKARYDLTRDWVVVAGDFNDNPTSAALQPVLNIPHLYDVLGLQFPEDPAKRWTYYYKKFEQIDYLLVSEPLKDRLQNAGVVRAGIHNLEKITSQSGGQVATERQYPTVTKATNAGSDHGAVWAKFKV